MTLSRSTTMSKEMKRMSARSSPWPGFLLRRLGSFFLSLWIIVTLVFFMSRSLSGDAVLASAGITASPEYIIARRAELGLDLPLLEQYFDFLRRILTLDFGESISTRELAMSLIGDRFPYTLQLGFLAFLVAIAASFPLGMAVAARAARHGRNDSSWFHAATGFVSSIPDFLLAVTLVSVFAIGLHALPPAGAKGVGALVLPVVTIATGLTATLSRIVATETSRVLKEEYVRTARSMRVSSLCLYGKHILPNVITATITYSGQLLAGLLGGTIITETVFAWPGIGSLTINSIRALDYPVLESIVLVVAALALLVTFAVDVVLALVDPRSLIVRS